MENTNFSRKLNGTRRWGHFSLIFAICLNGPLTYADERVQINNWGLHRISSQQALRITRGRSDIIIAVIDTGIDVNHPALVGHLWRNPNEKPNGIDDDKNGFIDDINGWNFSNKNANLTDTNGHGTHIAGIISAIAPNVKIMALKYFASGSNGKDNLINSNEALRYAIENGAQIINYSGGGTDKSSEEQRLLKLAKDKNILVVAAAGNEKSDSDTHPFYPADYDLENIISVTAIDQNSEILNSSNYGKNSVDVAAPGKDILSTWPNGKYEKMTGTSQATAFVTGTAALIMSNEMGKPNFDSIRKSLTLTTFSQPQLEQKTKTGTVVDGYRSLAIKSSDVNAFGLRIENLRDIKKDLFTIH